VLARLAELGASGVGELDGEPESMVFALPKELRLRLVDWPRKRLIHAWRGSTETALAGANLGSHAFSHARMGGLPMTFGHGAGHLTGLASEDSPLLEVAR
jgi:hypothetical protein